LPKRGTAREENEREPCGIEEEVNTTIASRTFITVGSFLVQDGRRGGKWLWG